MLAMQRLVDYQGVVAAMKVLPGYAECACFIHKHKSLGDPTHARE